MAVQTSTTGQLENASKEMIAQTIYTTEHNAPMKALVQNFKLRQGEDTGIFPKVSQMSMSSLTEGQDIVDEEDIGMSTVSVQTTEVGAKVILTDRLLRRNSSANWRVVGTQLGDAAARRMDEDLVGLFSGFSTDLGATTRVLSSDNAMAILTTAMEDKLGTDQRVVHHPVAIAKLGRELSTIGSGTIRPLPAGYSARVLDKFWTGINLLGVPFFQDGNISKDSSDDAVGAIFTPLALGMLTHQGWKRERQRDASLRAWELVMTADYAAFEHDDARGRALTLAAGTVATT